MPSSFARKLATMINLDTMTVGDIVSVLAPALTDEARRELLEWEMEHGNRPEVVNALGNPQSGASG